MASLQYWDDGFVGSSWTCLVLCTGRWCLYGLELVLGAGEFVGFSAAGTLSQAVVA